MRLDHFIASQCPDLSRKKAKNLVDQGLVSVNGRRLRYAAHTLTIGDDVQFEIPQKVEAADTILRLDDEAILFHRDGIIAINKPPGLLSQAGKNAKIPHALPLLQDYLKKKGMPFEHLWLLHRLDKETSGILLFAYEEDVAQAFLTAFKQRRVEKIYHALVYGVFDKDQTVENYLSPIDEKTGVVKVVKKNGNLAQTKFKCLKIFNNYGISLVQCEPKTGRSHQIRVHLAGLQRPIVGDKVYGQVEKTTLTPNLRHLVMLHHYLHAYRVRVSLTPIQNNSINIDFCAEYPQSWNNFLQGLTVS